MPAREQQHNRRVARYLKSNVTRREQHAAFTEGLRQCSGHEQACKGPEGQYREDRGRRRIEPVGHPSRVDPRTTHNRKAACTAPRTERSCRISPDSWVTAKT